MSERKRKAGVSRDFVRGGSGNQNPNRGSHVCGFRKENAWESTDMLKEGNCWLSSTVRTELRESALGLP